MKKTVTLEMAKDELAKQNYARKAEIETTGYVSSKTFAKYIKARDLVARLEQNEDKEYLDYLEREKREAHLFIYDDYKNTDK